ncbi:MAG: regulatory iron-sulfur-containing complex subunit RicT [bacterium]
MPQLIEIAFKGNRKEFFLWESDELPPRAAAVIVDADRGEDLGRVHAIGEEAERRSAKVPHGLFGAPPSRIVKRVATAEELRRHEEVREGDEDARRKAMDRVKANALVMKLTDAEWQWDRKKLTFYFTAEKRVDFRTLVRELASMFRTRIELKQIGVRDEAKRLDGIGRCGRQYCSASWLPELRPVNLGVAKDQRLSLNPSQISGACGRLMCCLRYEHEFYVQSRRKYPKETKTVRTARGEEKVLANDIFRERVTLRGMDGEVRNISLAELRGEMTVAGDPLAPALEAAAQDLPVSAAVADHEDGDDRSEVEGSLGDERPASLSRRDQRPVRPSRELREVRAPRETRAPLDSGALPSTWDSGAAADSTSDAAGADTPVSAGAEGEAVSDTEGAHRAQRRRGRRGGRRNRPGGGTASGEGTNNGGDAPSGE